MSNMQPTMPAAGPGEARQARGHIVALLRDLVHNCGVTAEDDNLTVEARQHAVRSELRRIADRIWTEAFVAGVAWQTAREPARFVLDIGPLDVTERQTLLAKLQQAVGEAPL